jgi:hypothetical protein
MVLITDRDAGDLLRRNRDPQAGADELIEYVAGRVGISDVR